MDMLSPRMTPETDDTTAPIREQIRSGDYFRDGLSWYSTKYQSAVVEKAYCVVITLIAVLSTWFSVNAVIGLHPISVEVPFVVPTHQIEKDLMSMHAIHEDEKDVNVALRSFLVEDYVKAREDYDASTIEKQVLRVRAQSAQDVNLAYRQRLNPSNPDSPISLYESHTVRKADVRRVMMEKQPGAADATSESYVATVDFISLTGRLNGDAPVRDQRQARVTFQYKPLEVNQDNFEITPMQFVVTQYQVEKKHINANE